MTNRRTNTKVLKMRGAGKAHPERMAERENEPKGEHINVKPPAGFTALEKNIWKEFIDGAPVGMLEQSDRHILEITTRLMARHRKNKGVMPAAELGQLLRGMSMLGKTPVDRSRVIAKGTKDKKDGWDDA